MKKEKKKGRYDVRRLVVANGIALALLMLTLLVTLWALGLLPSIWNFFF